MTAKVIERFRGTPAEIGQEIGESLAGDEWPSEDELADVLEDWLWQARRFHEWNSLELDEARRAASQAMREHGGVDVRIWATHFADRYR